MRSAILSLACLVVAFLVTAARAQDVKFEKYQLDNGMTVILHEDHSLPVVGINTWYRVGAKDEPPGRSGFAHLFEHLMFMGTERVPGNQFDVLMETGGGSNNASTSFDRTNYFSNGPSSLLPTLLWLDADRLEDLARTMTQEKLDLQREVVRNERRQSIENQPYGKAELRITEMMFPQGHPYHYEVIGTHEDLEAAQLTDVNDFFATFYVPNNASLVVAGDFDSSKIKPLIASLFGTIRRGADPVHKTAPPVVLSSVLRTTMIDQVQLPKVAIAYHSPAYYAEGDAEMDLLASILTQGKGSRLYKRLVLDDQSAVDVSAYQSSAALQSVFRIDILANPDADLHAIEKAVDEELARLLKDGISQAELAQRQATVELGKLAQLQSVAAKADKLNEYEFYFGTPDGFKRDLDRYRNATATSVQAWGAKVLTPGARCIVHILPDKPDRTASARDERPADSPTQPFQPAPPESFKLRNGIEVMVWNRPELPLVASTMLFTIGGPLDSPAQAGLSSLTAQMLGEGAGDLSAIEFADAMQSLGATFSADAGPETAEVSLTVLGRNAAPAMALAAAAVRSPRMESSDWERVQRLRLEDLKQEDDQPTIVASRLGQRLLYGADHPYGVSVSGTADTVSALTLDAIKARHRSLFQPANCRVLIAGDISASDAKTLLDGLLGDWAGQAPIPVPPPAPAIADAAPGLRVAIVDRPGAVQTVIRFASPGVTMSDERRVPLRLLNELFGGGFTSRLNQNLREKNGYTYGARSSFAMLPSAGWFSAASSVRADATGPAIQEFLNEFARLKAGDITAQEAEKARESQRTETVQSFAGLSGVLGVTAECLASGLPFSAIAADLNAMQSVDGPALNAAAKIVDLDRAVLVLVGDKAMILEHLKPLNLPAPVEYTVQGERVQ